MARAVARRAVRLVAPLLTASLLLAGCGSGAGTDGGDTAEGHAATSVFFGDSLTDAGSRGVRYTTLPGLTWAQIVDPDGLNYAVGGATIDGVTGQIDDFLTEYGEIGPDQFITVFTGTNDVLSGDDTAAVTAAEVDQIGRLLDAGAQQILVFTLFDLAATPAFGGRDTAAHLDIHDRTLTYNRSLLQGLAERFGEDDRIGVFDTFGAVNAMVTDPASHGFTHGAGEDACATPGAAWCDTGGLVAPDADRTYVFAGGVHLTTRTNELLAAAVEARVGELWGG
ncbi:SGNH/GDSL hydrolase family protein [uncultured Corynebacterium sp.]|uniref:SGNH/GDSL hydrolase family protein n=1 Tax=uncultured Corynebacterium sp. TaxID=159447 RepID=UPI0025D27A6E|nr:SGNH/GDSL hydrolase family protein [uncultured Corynebacterium sp.]